jgi:hypothetical protein
MTIRMIAGLAVCLASVTASPSDLTFLLGEITKGGFYVSLARRPWSSARVFYSPTLPRSAWISSGSQCSGG